MTTLTRRRLRPMRLGTVVLAVVTIGMVMTGAGTAAATSLAPSAPAVGGSRVAATNDDEPDVPEDDASTADNEFWPEDRDIGECLGALERPGCGSEERGGWRQAIVFGVVVVALALIGWRLVVLVRRRDDTSATAGDEAEDRRDDGEPGDDTENPTGDPPSRSGV